MKRTALAIAIGALCGGLSAATLAQESGQTEQGQQQGQMGQQGQQGQMGQQGQQGQMGQQGQQGQMGQQGQQGQMGQAEGQQTQQGESGSQQEGRQNLMSMPASEIEGMQVVNQEGQELGEVERVAVSTQDNQVFVVVSVGGFLGIGDESVALPLQEMNLQEDQLVLQTSRSEDELQQSAEEYNEEDYQTVEGETTLSDAASGGSMSGGSGGSMGGDS